MISTSETAWPTTPADSAAISEMRMAARAVEAPGAANSVVLGPRALCCLAVLLRHHVREAQIGEINHAALLLAGTINDQIEGLPSPRGPRGHPGCAAPAWLMGRC